MTEKPKTKKQIKADERAEAIAMLHKYLKPGSKVYTVLRHVSKSGMSRQIDLYTFDEHGKVYLTGYAATALDDRRADNGAIVVGGCGMDMGFHLVYSLSRAMFPNGFKPSEAGRGYGRNGTSPDELDTDGGYALSHEWL